MNCRSLRAKRGNLQLFRVNHLEIATVACGNLAMTFAVFFNSLLDKQFEHLRESEYEKRNDIYPKNKKDKIRMFVESLLNNNQGEYFYLEPEAAIGFTEPMVAFLKLSIAIRAQDHYEKCRSTRVGQLNNHFQAKLGWLVGSSYARVATPDWLQSNRTKEEYNERINSLLTAYAWIDPTAIEQVRQEEEILKKSGGPQATLTDDKGKEIIKSVRANREKQRKLLADKLVTHVRDIHPEFPSDKVPVLLQRFKTADDISVHVKK